ncbi:shikimate kinase [Formosa sediminum]|uniref:Shikimate kinase n=1 Tax=Formosa sediminum TaxID=2594004 RepID=A0A516GRL4_9FLAO|nr:shikimate kinase [Formosa sediminum]QDO94156.1 shikimate kinase [Formosa sediminum]
MIIILIGYMGSGKSTLGKTLAKTLEYPFIDLDDYIEAQEEVTIPELFKTHGEVYFRKQEHIYLKALLTEQKNVVLALGGGTPCYANNMELIKQHANAKSFYFKAGIQELTQRLKHDKNNRPLLSRFNTDDELVEFIGKHLFERTVYYNQADVIISVDQTTETEVIAQLMPHLV